MELYKTDAFLDELLLEDCPYMDLTVELLGIGDRPGELVCSPRENCVLAGVETAAALWEKCGARVDRHARSGDRLIAGQPFLSVRGRAADLHRALKIAQNIMEYMTGIATRTADMLERARAVRPDVQVAVTRKNFPGAKRLCLEAATCAGARVHRLGLSDSVLIFDQHRVFLRHEPRSEAGENAPTPSPVELLAARVPALRRALPEKILAAEVNTPEEAFILAKAGMDSIQCEKFSSTELAATVKQIRLMRPDILILAAGGIRSDNAADYAAAGADVLVTSWVYTGKPADIHIEARAAD